MKSMPKRILFPLPITTAVEELKAFCHEHHIAVAQLAIAWVLAQPAITSAIVGASKPEQLDQSLPAANLVLDEQMLAVCDDIWYRLPRERNRTSPLEKEAILL